MPKQCESFISSVKGNKISGIALIPRISRNQNLYTKGELERAEGVKARLDWEHDVNQIIGEVTFHYDRENEQVLYDGVITDAEALERIRGKDIYTSIEVDVSREQKICNNGKMHDCFNMLSGLEFVGLALTETPGVPETTLEIREHTIKNYIESPEKHIDHDKPYILPRQSLGMTTERTVKEAKVTEEELPTAGVDQEKPSEEVPTDMKIVDGMPVPADNTEMGNGHGKDKPKEMGMGDDDKMKDKEMGNGDDKDDMKESKPVGQPKFASASQLEDFAKRIEQNVAKQIESVNANTDNKIKTFGEGLVKPNIIKLAPSTIGDLHAESLNMWNSVRNNGYYAATVDVGSNKEITESYLPASIVQEQIRRKNEAIAFSGDQSNKVAVTSRIRVRPNGNYTRTIRDLVQFYEIPQGTDEIKLSYIDPPTIQTFTEGTETAATTHTDTSILITADTVNGNAQVIKAADIEDTPQDLLPALAESARISMLNSEASLVFNTAAEAATPGRWLDGTGATVTEDAGFTAAGSTGAETFDHNALAAALAYYQEQGYDTSFGNVKCAIHPTALQQLRVSTPIQRYVQDGIATITQTGDLAHLYGIELIPMNVIPKSEQGTVDPHRNICFIPDSSFILGSKRDLTIDIQKRPRSSSYDWAWTQRKGAKAFDAKTIVRISSSN